MDFLIESQVKPFATFGDFPATGAVKTIYIDQATSNQYYWNGSTYIALSDTNKVPYSGAIANVDLGEFQLKAGQVELDQTPTGTTGVAKMRWNDSDGTVDVGLKGGNVTLQLGLEELVRVVNKSGVTLAESAYQAVRFRLVSEGGAAGQRLAVVLAQANNDLNSATTIGLVTETIANNQEGFINRGGEVRGINTTGSLQGETWVDGDILYLSPTTPGALTNIKPTAPDHSITIGYVVYSHAVNGKIFVKVDNGYELEELHNVSADNYTTPQDEDSILTFDSIQLLWKRLTLQNLVNYLSSFFQSKAYIHRTFIQGANVTGTTSEVQVFQLLIPANTFSATDKLSFFAVFSRVTATTLVSIRAKISTSATMPSGATSMIARVNPAASNIYAKIGRDMIISGGNVKGYPNNTTASSDFATATAAASSQAMDVTVDNYFYLSVQLTAATDDVRLEAIEIKNI